jgi:hypothetical protein
MGAVATCLEDDGGLLDERCLRMVIQMLPGLAALLEGCANDRSVACLQRLGSDNKFRYCGSGSFLAFPRSAVTLCDEALGMGGELAGVGRSFGRSGNASNRSKEGRNGPLCKLYRHLFPKLQSVSIRASLLAAFRDILASS